MFELPAGLHGAHRRDDLRREFGAIHLRKIIREGRLMPFSRKVLVERARQLALPTRAAATLLLAGPRAVLTSHTAASLLGCTAADTGRTHVLVDYQLNLPRVPGVAIHQGLFDEQDVLTLDGLRVFALEYAITEMLCREPRRVALACADQALALLPFEQRAEFRAEILHRIGVRRDPRGRRRSQILLDLASGKAESPAESWLLLSFFDAGFSVPEQQFPVSNLSGREIYRLDFAWPEPMVAVEYDGYAAHVDRMVRDAARDEDLRRRGWLVLRADATDLSDPSRLHAEVRQAFWRRRFAA
ncbi:MAG: DUF559 domain-containing protein [Actinophytocola sp.]|uniref:endonuclease domain-containing protein n=1 Tax=Actinophytocola sp. TaxID=1872138 RepID=UPI003C7412A7